ncbi:hypothetical protein D9758_009347 [Tetrapyrgos nigripes]|uniref:RING-type domain-containing protein n=1 Tax=Tetrapyrgos nigripes TaxID=182062 RepID=A0A8H5LPK7_9AGAR|nr:hypothetical protein D9758_009347 [Tetrapyrgos nigripes]
MDQNTSTIAELRAEQVDQISGNISRLSYRLASLDPSADTDSSSSSPLPRRLQWVVDRSKELFNELEPKQLVVVLPTIRQLMERVDERKWLDFGELDNFAKLLSRLVILKERKNKLPVVRFLPCISDFPPSELNGPAPAEWLAMFVHSDIPSVCIEDHNACCNVCLEDFEEPALAAEFQVDGDDDDGTQGSPKPLRQLTCGHVLHEDCLPMFQIDGYDEMFECPVCRAEIWTSPPSSPLSAEIPRDSVLNSISLDQQQTYGNYYYSPPPWLKIDENSLEWAAWYRRVGKLDEALNSTTHGHPVNLIALGIWGDQTYMRYVYSRITDGPEGLVDCLIVGPDRAQSIGAHISEGEHEDASRQLRGYWDFLGLQYAPHFLAVLNKHNCQDECHWVVHRFSLLDGALTTYHFHTDLHACPDCRPVSWWSIICLAWPNAAICSNPGMPTLIHLHQPMELGVDDCLAAAGVRHNILMGLPAEHSVDLECLRDLMHTEVKGLCERHNSSVTYLSTFFGDLHGRSERVEGNKLDP